MVKKCNDLAKEINKPDYKWDDDEAIMELEMELEVSKMENKILTDLKAHCEQMIKFNDESIVLQRKNNFGEITEYLRGWNAGYSCIINYLKVKGVQK